MENQNEIKIQISRNPFDHSKRIFTAWEPSEIAGRHSTITTIDGRWYGRIGTGPDRKLYEHLPVGEERSEAVKKAYEAEYERAYKAIRAAHREETSIAEYGMGEMIA